MADERTVWGRSVEAIGMYYIFFFNDTATTEIYTLSLHDALPIFYALATIAFQALTGTLPRAGKTVVAVLSQARREPPPDLRERRPDAPAAAAELEGRVGFEDEHLAVKTWQRLTEASDGVELVGADRKSVV